MIRGEFSLSDPWREKYGTLKRELAEKDIDVEEVEQKIRNLEVETPSWGYSDAGTTFARFEEPYSARNIEERA